MIKIKPLSINKAYSGRRKKTQECRRYTKELFIKLPEIDIPDSKLELIIQFGFSSKGSDIDNCVKVFQDVLQDKYGFNDNMIYRLVVNKCIVKKGDEYINFKINRY